MAKTKQNTVYNRWWTTIDGARVIRTFDLDIDPNTLPHNTHQWLRGCGPYTQERRERYVEVAKKLQGIAKTDQHRAAMSAAATGVPKSEQHVESMRRSHQQRIERVRVIQRDNPQLTFHEAVKLEAQRRKTGVHNE